LKCTFADWFITFPECDFWNDMTYVISYISGASETSERWVGNLPLAQAVARNAVANGIAQRVKILDRNGAVIFKHPRTPIP
jgi:hypothetical protein